MAPDVKQPFNRLLSGGIIVHTLVRADGGGGGGDGSGRDDNDVLISLPVTLQTVSRAATQTSYAFLSDFLLFIKITIRVSGGPRYIEPRTIQGELYTTRPPYLLYRR